MIAAVNNAITPGTWQLITVMRRINPDQNGQDRMDIYINDRRQVGTYYSPNTLLDLSPVAENIFIGTYEHNNNPTAPVSNAFNGLLDEIAIFHKALSDEEVAAIYNAGGAGMCK